MKYERFCQTFNLNVYYLGQIIVKDTVIKLNEF